jgi:histidine triad (HIT) family protein
MATLFTRIIDGELPGRFVWRDPKCVVFLTIAPLAPGHALVVPRAEVDQWTDLEPELLAHLMDVARVVAQAQKQAFAPARVGVIIAGLEVPHVHVHLVPIDSESQLNFANADPNTPGEALDAAAEKLRGALREAGRSEVAAAG